MGLRQLFFRQFQRDVYFLGGKKAAGFYNIGNGSDIGMLYLLTVNKIIHKVFNFAMNLFHRVIDYQTDSVMIFNFCLLKRGGKTSVRR